MRATSNIPRYIKLVSQDHLGVDEARVWHKTVMAHGPSGVIASIDSVDNQGKISTTRLVRRSKGDTTELIIPLVRDLLPHELEKIADAWRNVSPPGNFTIGINATQDQKMSQAVSDLTLDQDEHQALCLQLAKVQHDAWIREKANSGWSYGPVLSIQNKTHPLMRPWIELPAQYRDVNTNNPENFLNFLNNQGFAVVKQTELGSLLKILRDIR